MYYSNINPKFTFYENKNPLHELRTHRLATGRNYLIEQIDAKKDKYPLFIMMDCDDVCDGNININLLKNSLSRMNEWDSLSFWGHNKNNENNYYDTWALSIHPYVLPFHYFKNISAILSKRLCYINRLNKKAIQLNSYIPCYSAFSGFAIYKTARFVNCRYNGDNNVNYIPLKIVAKNLKVEPTIMSKQDILNCKEDCEHRSFHFQSIMKNKSRIRLSPYYLFT